MKKNFTNDLNMNWSQRVVFIAWKSDPFTEVQIKLFELWAQSDQLNWLIITARSGNYPISQSCGSSENGYTGQRFESKNVHSIFTQIEKKENSSNSAVGNVLREINKDRLVWSDRKVTRNTNKLLFKTTMSSSERTALTSMPQSQTKITISTYSDVWCEL